MILKILTIVVLVVLRLFPRIEQCCFQKENFHFIWSLLSHNNKKNGGTVKGCNPNCVFHPPVFVHIFSKITGNLFKKKSIYCKKVFTLGWGGSAMGTDLAKKSCCMLITQASTEEIAADMRSVWRNKTVTIIELIHEININAIMFSTLFSILWDPQRFNGTQLENKRHQLFL